MFNSITILNERHNMHVLFIGFLGKYQFSCPQTLFLFFFPGETRGTVCQEPASGFKLQK